ncbi:hypothetical protein [Porphyromonas endodontalis]|uniref:Uncharacterized protein n=1 Tax=Porphyromonas endodontalis (strain ATCC 35406 / DSM 24491 / JCM 8526 / CCUG 16442 / BCRC 14492 / NCTC 13058 / HG 370) TaxID=553175 RepID=C3JB90_POREA|nr:hypothetical protein [Porphyromonas endodontalis]EEN82590.1 hypothetical protein POREN0001_1533 [Porphyromonas endodontalis ATCC 35406]UBH64712.1 hypothetical protein LA319_00515 [Porphyromonas endodontalis]SUB76812.1 Uncharacterised protein [Porphyromonas endodontalis]
MSVEFAKCGRGYAAIVRTVGTSNRRSSVVRKECMMEGGLRFVLELTEREYKI